MRVFHYQLPAALVDTFTYLGLLLVAYQLLRLIRFIDFHNRLSNIHTYRHHKSWALVTGASDGIGLAFAQELSERGFNIVLHGRNAEKLERVRGALLKKTLVVPIDVRVVVADASNSHGMKGAIESVVASLEDLPGPLTVLVNNVGGTGAMASTFTSLGAYTPADVDGVVNLNARFTTQLTRALLPMLRKSKPSLVVNMGSITGYGAPMGMPYLSVYSGTKAYILAWSQALTREMIFEESGVQVLGLVVGGVTDATHDRKPGTLFTPRARTFVSAALGKVGCGKGVVTPYWPHALQMLLFGLMPGNWRSRVLLNAVASRKKAEAKTR